MECASITARVAVEQETLNERGSLLDERYDDGLILI
jgi:hypothetical protein